jgi:hypothetical protein
MSNATPEVPRGDPDMPFNDSNFELAFQFLNEA